MPTDVADTTIFEPSGTAFIRDPLRPILTYRRILPAGRSVRPHSHARSQLLWSMRGVLRLISGASVWVVPPSHAVWVPGGLAHQVATETEVEFLNLYVDPSRPLRAGSSAEACTVLMLTPLARELIRRLAESDTRQPFDGRLMRLVDVIADEIEDLADARLSLPGGRDARLIRVTRLLVEFPNSHRSLTEFAALAGASPRTLERLFRSETGLTFRQWRSRARLLASVDALNRGQSSAAIAWSLGYRSPSAFIAAFREHFGTTPQRFLLGD
ncbi:AraC family transcriptional regulator [Aureimonas fodinaquatilis]|uniref:AraC family transcriptional regulator n=1 Tax=Aureimonas fodinaquatilis TaxID=2565783 RepID=A0A5B0DV86_9HYPH|nr:helix-turn-helix transcriptional regulator [Aureimonas fodinaquatilis]KAA0969520.1 AraC family transcriptional regulator [Aureimonas fodinaquatilis]